MMGCWLTSARDDSVWGSVSGAGEAAVAKRRVNARNCAVGDSSRLHPPRLFALLCASCSYDPVHQRAQEYDDAHNAIRREECGIESREIARLHELVFPGNQP